MASTRIAEGADRVADNVWTALEPILDSIAAQLEMRPTSRSDRVDR